MRKDTELTPIPAFYDRGSPSHRRSASNTMATVHPARLYTLQPHRQTPQDRSLACITRRGNLSTLPFTLTERQHVKLIEKDAVITALGGECTIPSLGEHNTNCGPRSRAIKVDAGPNEQKKDMSQVMESPLHIMWPMPVYQFQNALCRRR